MTTGAFVKPMTPELFSRVQRLRLISSVNAMLSEAAAARKDEWPTEQLQELWMILVKVRGKRQAVSGIPLAPR